MKLKDLGFNRQMFKTDQSLDTQDSVYASNNPSNYANPLPVSLGNPKTSDAKQILTGTVIDSCIWRSSSLPARVEISSNDMYLYDDSKGGGGTISGNTASLVFARADQKSGTFLIQKRHATTNDLGNVFEMYYEDLASGGQDNYIFFGRSGDLSAPSYFTGAIYSNVDITTAKAAGYGNGIYGISVSTNKVTPLGFAFIAGDTRTIIGSGTGYSSLMNADNGGTVGFTYAAGNGGGTVLYCNDLTKITLGLSLIPDTNAAYDIGSPSLKIRNFYGSVVACPLPTVENALDILKKIPEPVHVGERGHYGEGLYFDDLTFPEEVLHETDGKKDIEHTRMIGFLMKTVIELNKKVEDLEKIIYKQ